MSQLRGASGLKAILRVEIEWDEAAVRNEFPFCPWQLSDPRTPLRVYDAPRQRVATQRVRDAARPRRVQG
jgi:hypothetical protein